MRKRRKIGKLGIAALAAAMITTCLIGGTLAKYTSEAKATGSAAVAKWSVKFSEGSTAFTGDSHTFTLKDTGVNAANVTDGKIAPGSTGSVELSVDGTGTETAYKYSITLDKSGLNGVPVKFYSDSAMNTEVTTANLVSDKAVALNAANKNEKTTLYWKWAGADDTADTTAGTTAATGTFKVTLTATQDITTAP